MKKILSILTSLFLTATLLAGCSNSAKSDSGSAVESNTGSSSGGTTSSTADGYSTSLEDIKTNGELIIGLDDQFAPMGFRDTDGSLVGFDIDLATAVCEKLGITANFQPIDWNSKEMELSTGSIDCIWNGMSITPEREKNMSLSNPYLENRIVVMTRDGIVIATKEELANFNIGIQSGSAALEAVQNDPIWEIIQSNVTEYPTYDEVILDMNTERLDCMIIDEVFGNYKNSKMDGKFGTADFDFGNDLYAVGFRKSDTELTEAINKAIQELIDEGKASEISQKWFGADVVLSTVK